MSERSEASTPMSLTVGVDVGGTKILAGVVDEDGTITRLVPDDKRAWHAGASHWRGVTDVNSASIGIEIVNDGVPGGTRPELRGLATLRERVARDGGSLTAVVTDGRFRTAATLPGEAG